MATIENAIRIAPKAHDGQKDKAGAPYILHPLRLMMRMDSPAEQIVAILHDVVEDSPLTIGDLRREGFSEDVLAAVDQLTKRSDVSYEDYIRGIATNPLAVRVKIADLEDNMNLTRLNALNPADFERLQKYHSAWTLLTGK